MKNDKYLSLKKLILSKKNINLKDLEIRNAVDEILCLLFKIPDY